MRIKAQLTANRSPTSEPLSYCGIARIRANHYTLSRVGSQSGYNVIYLWPGRFICIPYYVQGRSHVSSHLVSSHTFKLPHLHVLRPGPLISNKVQYYSTTVQYCTTAVLCDFTYDKGLLHVKAIRVIYQYLFSVPL